MASSWFTSVADCTAAMSGLSATERSDCDCDELGSAQSRWIIHQSAHPLLVHLPTLRVDASSPSCEWRLLRHPSVHPAGAMSVSVDDHERIMKQALQVTWQQNQNSD